MPDVQQSIGRSEQIYPQEETVRPGITQAFFYPGFETYGKACMLNITIFDELWQYSAGKRVVYAGMIAFKRCSPARNY
jgi:hypothetical protein